MAKVLGVGGIFFKANEPQKLAQWYAEHLGLTIETTFNGAVFKHSNSPENGATVWSPFAKDTQYFAPSHQDFMFNFIVDDVSQALEQVVAGEGTSLGVSEEEGLGVFGWFIDPEGNKVELWQPVEN
jgi:predicted enzyme related to lactoylglutathione lyase